MAVAGGAHGYVQHRRRVDRGDVRRRERSAAPSGAAGRTLTPFPWKEAIGFGLGVLRLSPEHFWRMTPRELALAIEAVCGRAPSRSRVRPSTN